MNKSFIENIEKQITDLKLEIERVNDFKPQKGFEIITSTVKRMYIHEIENLISHNHIRMMNSKREGDTFVKVMMDQLFTGGVKLPGRDGAEELHSFKVNTLMSFENQLEIAIDITKKFNLTQCDIPQSKDGKKRLEWNLIQGTTDRDFDLYDNYKVFENQINRVMKDMKYIFNVEPHKQKEWDGRTKLGFKIMCA
jgi:hypothetical protein